MKRHGIIAAPAGDIGAVFNPAAARLDDGRFVLLARSVPKGYAKTGPVNQFDDNYTSHLSQWEGSAPDSFALTNAHALMPGPAFDRFGVEDPRITKIKDTYYICYTSIAIGLGQPDAGNGIRIAMGSTKDFRTYTKHGVIGPDRRSKAGAVFESGGKNWFLWKDEAAAERTMLTPAPDDIENPAAWKALWAGRDIEKDKLLGPQNNAFEGLGVEPGAPPLETDKGLLTVYSSISEDFKWTISAMLLDKADPSRILGRTAAPLLVPREPYELQGDVSNVVFPCGALVHEKRLYVYYGAADRVCAAASEELDIVLQPLKPKGPVP